MNKEPLEDWEKAITQCDKTKKVIIKLVDENTILTDRVQELEELLIQEKYDKDLFNARTEEWIKLKQQNKCYREILEDVINNAPLPKLERAMLKRSVKKVEGEE